MNQKKTLKFLVEVEFADAVTNHIQITEVADNIAEAIQDATNGKGIAPQINIENGDTYTKCVQVTSMNVEALKYTAKIIIV